MSEESQEEVSSAVELQAAKREGSVAVDPSLVSQKNANDGLLWVSYSTFSKRQVLQSHLQVFEIRMLPHRHVLLPDVQIRQQSVDH